MQKLFTLFVLVGILIQAGCAATAYLRSNQAIINPFNKNATIYLDASENMTVEEANFMVLLLSGIRKYGLKMAENLAKADYVLKFAIKEPIFYGQAVSFEPVLTAPYLGREGPVSYYPVNYSYSYPGLSINVMIFKKRNFIKSPHIPLWEASLSVKKELYRDHAPELIKIILDHVGQQFEGRVSVR
ncbi:MAG TPA: hypothetical protein VEL47_04065 [Myxococcota bacterium]|nr:hypothetical protein [Myxococcota bacterium]